MWLWNLFNSKINTMLSLLLLTSLVQSSQSEVYRWGEITLLTVFLKSFSFLSWIKNSETKKISFGNWTLDTKQNLKLRFKKRRVYLTPA